MNVKSKNATRDLIYILTTTTKKIIKKKYTVLCFIEQKHKYPLDTTEKRLKG